MAISFTTSWPAARRPRTRSAASIAIRASGTARDSNGSTSLMTDQPSPAPTSPAAPAHRGRPVWLFIGVTLVVAVLVFLITALLMNIFTRKVEARNPYVRLVEVTEETTDPAPWGVNWSREYDDYKRTV